MKQLTINIPDNKFQYVLDLLSKLGFVKIDKSGDNSMTDNSMTIKEQEKTAMPNVPDWQVELGRKEMHNVANGKTELMDWEKHLLLVDQRAQSSTG